MISKEQFNQIVDAIMAQGYDEDSASNYAGLIGDTPNVNSENGKWRVVSRKGELLAEIDPLD